MTYCEKLEQLRNEVLEELKRQVPTRHDFIDLIDEADEQNRECMPLINIRHKHGLYSTEYVLGLRNFDGEIQVNTEDTESCDTARYPIEWLSTAELCELLDTILDKVIENKN